MSDINGDVMVDFEIRADKDGEVHIFSLVGVLNIYSSHELKKELFDLAEEGNVKLVLDFTHLVAIDSAGIGTLISMLQRIRRMAGARMVICNLVGQVEKIFLVTRIGGLFEIAPGVDEAVEMIRN